jgi:glycosyltransferase involved in cell wall biosynthesis
VAPMPWYTQSPRAGDLIPDRWIRLDRSCGIAWPVQRLRLPTPRITAVVLARSGPAALQRALNSVRSQSYANLDIVIALCDSAAETVAAAAELASHDDRTRLVQASRPGLGAALNAGLAQAEGEWIAFLDDCDIWLPSKIEVQLEAAHLASAPVVSCRTMPIEGPHGVPAIFPPPGPPSLSLPRLLKSGHFISGISHVLVHRRIVDAVGSFDDQWSPEEDNNAWRRLLWDHHIVMLWERLVKSPIPYLGRSATLAPAR